MAWNDPKKTQDLPAPTPYDKNKFGVQRYFLLLSLLLRWGLFVMRSINDDYEYLIKQLFNNAILVHKKGQPLEQ